MSCLNGRQPYQTFNVYITEFLDFKDSWTLRILDLCFNINLSLTSEL